MSFTRHFIEVPEKVKREISALQGVQRYCAANFRLAARAGNCACARLRRQWYMLGVADFLMEEVLILERFPVYGNGR